MLELRVDGEVTLALLEEQHAAELFRLVDANRAYLRQWLCAGLLDYVFGASSA